MSITSVEWFDGGLGTGRTLRRVLAVGEPGNWIRFQSRLEFESRWYHEHATPALIATADGHWKEAQGAVAESRSREYKVAPPE